MSARYYSRIDSPVGELLLLGDGKALTGMYMLKQRHGPVGPQDAKRDDALFLEAAKQLAAYFAGELRIFDLPLSPEGTSFQKKVWRGLLDIPYGVTESYGELAKRIGHDLGARAVGLANGRNPIGIIIPCHRVIGANGSLTGYGGGLERKQWLLEHEQSYSQPRTPTQAQLNW
jgi:methylated-DNA-[protein]-cysteine S-methyltransferase